MAQAARRLHPQLSPRHAFGAAVREWRTLRALSQADLGTLVFVSKDQIGKIEKALRWPSPDLVTGLDVALDAGGALAAFWPSLQAQRQSSRQPSLPTTTSLEQAALDWVLVDSAPRMLATSEAHWIDEEVAVGASRQLDWFRQLDHVHGAGRIHPLVSSYVGAELERLLAGVPVDQETAVRLYSTAAGFWELAGYQAIDLGNDQHAQSCYLRALELATAAGDRLYGGYLLSVSSAHLALHLGDVSGALRMARAGLHGTQKISGPVVRSAFGSVLARAYARGGDEQASTRALLDAEADLARGVPGEEPAWIGYFSQAYLADEMAHCFHDLGRQRLAQEQADDALSRISPSHVRRLAIDTALMASSLARAGQVEEACSTGRRAIDYAAQTSSARSRQRVSDLREELVPFSGLPLVREFEDYAREALPA
ncbi:helix-turn-helix transcriptional regulator [Longispora urticae]